MLIYPRKTVEQGIDPLIVNYLLQEEILKFFRNLTKTLKNCAMDTFCTAFLHMQGKKIFFQKIYCSYFFPFLDFYCCAKL